MTGILLLMGLLLPFVGPVALIFSLIADLVGRNRRLRRFRGALLVCTLIVIDIMGRALVFGNWLVAPLGMNLSGIKSQRRYRWIMTWWTTALMWAITRITPLPFDTTELDESLLGGNAIVIGRHRSLLDAVLPATVFGQLGLTVLYTLKEDLRWEPNIDIVGHRMGHVFVTRSPKDLEAELAPIRHLGTRIDDNAVGVIFPEGTFFTPQRKARALSSIAKRNPERLELAETLDFVLPPRPAGTLALLEGAPDADVIMLGHTGFEPYGSIGQIFANMGAIHPIRLKAWRYSRADIPTDRDALITWLFSQWNVLDEWVSGHHPLPGHDSPSELIDATKADHEG